MANSSGSKAGGSQPPATPPSKPAKKATNKGEPAGEVQPAPEVAPDTDPSIDVPMKWLALRARTGGNYLLEDVVITLPEVSNGIMRAGGDTGDNVLITPFPADLVDALSKAHPDACKPVKGRLPQLKLFPGYTVGNNQALWLDYLDAHPNRTASVSEADWKNKPLTLRKE